MSHHAVSAVMLKVPGIVAVLLAVSWMSCPASVLPEESRRPNVLIIISDDQRFDTLGRFMPRTQARIFDEGVHFRHAYITTPLCCPSRASILTGMYARKTGVQRNRDILRKATVMEHLHASGYFTGLVGKYLNSWDGSPRPEYDFWVAFAGTGSASTWAILGAPRYFNPMLNVGGMWRLQTGYLTYLLRDYALGFLQEAMKKDQPFALIFAPYAPHAPAAPAPGHRYLYPRLRPHRPPNYNEDDLSGKPAWLQRRPPLTPEQQKQIDDFRRRQLQTLWSLDQAIGAILDELDRQGRLADTAIFYLSDNGYFWGEHRLQGKERVYEEAIRVPFALRFPRLVPIGQVRDELVANIDIAPTIYELAGLPAPSGIDGRSLVPLLRGEGPWRDELLIEAWPLRAPYAAIHTGRYVYVETDNDVSELYDLETDRYQLKNAIDDPTFLDLIIDMRDRLKRLRELTISTAQGTSR